MADRSVVSHNSEQAERDAVVRERVPALLDEKIERSNALSRAKRAEVRGKISTMPGLNRFLIRFVGRRRFCSDNCREMAWARNHQNL